MRPKETREFLSESWDSARDIAAQVSAKYSVLGSRLGMIGNHRSKFERYPIEDRHSFVVLGPTNDAVDLYVIDWVSAGTQDRNLRIRRLSDIVQSYMANSLNVIQFVAFLNEPLADFIKNECS